MPIRSAALIRLPDDNLCIAVSASICTEAVAALVIRALAFVPIEIIKSGALDQLLLS